MGVSYTYDFGDDHAALLRKVIRGTPREQAFEECPTLTMLEKRTMPLEGHYYHVNVSHVGTATGGPYVDNTVLSTVHVESLKVAQYTPSFYGEAARMSRPQKLQTRGPRALFNAWVERLTQAKMRLKDKMADDLYATSQVTNGITGLPLAIPVTTTTGTFGLNRATYTWWRNYSSATITWSSAGTAALDTMFIRIRGATGKYPDWCVTTEAVYAKITAAARSTINFNPTYTGSYKQQLNDMSIDAVSFHGKPIFPDSHCDSGKLYAVTSDALYLGTFEEWVVEGPDTMRPFGVQADVAFVLWGGAMICESQRSLGVLSSIT